MLHPLTAPLTVAGPARAFYGACGLEISPISPSRCAPPGLAYAHAILQQLWDGAAAAAMAQRGVATRAYLLEQATRRAEAVARAAAKVAAKAAARVVATASAKAQNLWRFQV